MLTDRVDRLKNIYKECALIRKLLIPSNLYGPYPHPHSITAQCPGGLQRDLLLPHQPGSRGPPSSGLSCTLKNFLSQHFLASPATLCLLLAPFPRLQLPGSRACSPRLFLTCPRPRHCRFPANVYTELNSCPSHTLFCFSFNWPPIWQVESYHFPGKQYTQGGGRECVCLGWTAWGLPPTVVPRPSYSALQCLGAPHL